ncbi:MAG: ABC transporter ATP-binding protein [Actinomycetaceae bacterium]|nr:ABC transporter ATP-binding protein [Actinomycetaceae bacterium]
MTALKAIELSLAYGHRKVIEGLDVTFPDGEFTAIVGPNACGKSTLLRGLSRLMSPTSGHVYLNGKDIASRATVDIAKELGMLPQSHTMPEGLKVVDLISRGRFPYQTFLRRWSDEDDQAVAQALRTTGIEDLAQRRVEELSGGQRQRVWLATVLAQNPQTILLDEPTTYLDLAHQVDVLELLAALPMQGHTVIAVLHDLNLAARYATHMIAMSAGEIVAHGAPTKILTAELMDQAFGVKCRIIDDPETGTPLVVPKKNLRRPGP